MNPKVRCVRSEMRPTLGVLALAIAVATLVAGCSRSGGEAEPAPKATETAKGSALTRPPV